MAGKPPDRIVKGVRRSDFLDDHHELMALADGVEAAPTVQAVIEPLRALAAVLPGHLADEERQDGLFEWLIALAGPEPFEMAWVGRPPLARL